MKSEKIFKGFMIQRSCFEIGATRLDSKFKISFFKKENHCNNGGLIKCLITGVWMCGIIVANHLTY